MYILYHYILGSITVEVAMEFTFAATQIDFERQARATFFSRLILQDTKKKAQQEKATSQALLESVVPKSILERLLSDTKGNFLAEYVPSVSVLVVTIDRFEELQKAVKPSEIVKLLNALFSHFDRLTDAHGLEPLKTNSGEYIVVGNVLNDMNEDHATRVVRLALNMMKSLEEFNAKQNPVGIRVNLKIGIHTCPIVSCCCFSFFLPSL